MQNRIRHNGRTYVTAGCCIRKYACRGEVYDTSTKKPKRQSSPFENLVNTLGLDKVKKIISNIKVLEFQNGELLIGMKGKAFWKMEMKSLKLRKKNKLHVDWRKMGPLNEYNDHD